MGPFDTIMIDIDSDVPVYLQIENQILFALATGKAAVGDILPSVRQMSETLDVNPNTVNKAYRDLELLGMVRSRRGVGVTVLEAAPAIATERISGFVVKHLLQGVAECLAAGRSGKEIIETVKNAIARDILPYRKD